MNNLSVDKRVGIGKKYEDIALKCLREVYKYNFIDSTHQEDCHEKTDCWLVGKNGKSRCAIKARLNKSGQLEDKRTDILFALRDPFYGINHPDTAIGRDVLYEYSVYISLIKDQIRMVNGSAAHRICNALWLEFMENNPYLVPDQRGFGCKCVLQSQKIEGCQIWLNYDASTKKPKLLAFVPPKCLKKDKEIKIHKLIEA